MSFYPAKLKRVTGYRVRAHLFNLLNKLDVRVPVRYGQEFVSIK